MKKNVVFSTISIDHDIADADSRWKLWRPLVELVQVRKFFIHRLYYFIPEQFFAAVLCRELSFLRSVLQFLFL